MPKIPRKIRRWLREITVIFIGISLAFLVENFRSNREDHARLEHHLLAISKALTTDSIMNEMYINFTTSKVRRVDSLYTLIENSNGAREKLLMLAYLQEFREVENLDNAFHGFQNSGDYSLLGFDLREQLSIYYKTAEIYKRIDQRQMQWMTQELHPYCDKVMHPDDNKFFQYGSPNDDFGKWHDNPPQFKSRAEDLDKIIILNYAKRCRELWNLMAGKYVNDRKKIGQLRRSIAQYID